MSQKQALKFHWVAKFHDGSVVRQFEGDVEKHHFGHVWGRKALHSHEELVEFQLISSVDPSIVYSVNLKDGVFNLNGERVSPKFDFAIPADKTIADMGDVKIKPLYWRRTRQHLFSDVGTQIRHLFGYEIMYRGNTAKKVFALNMAGEWEELKEEELSTVKAADGDFVSLK